ncbi:MbcA/ParS/Xre antitoxin family protein [Pseudoalteromonas atlantica]|uniref:MbcA/ParS/Xre antitoxin family protein n=1 Tax=Pseudoalteromonas atlantica TaxID=288 RepID=UPI000BBC4E05|nr:MbcA/ParS/Xre antitoxin family protein [Pseudoalteromonas atlantica]
MNLKSTETAKIALKTYFNIMKEWDVSESKQLILLGRPDEFTFERWKRGSVTTLTSDVLERISYVLGIYKNLGVLFSQRAQANEWLNKPNEAFNGSTALNCMLLGTIGNLREVRYYLDEQL